MDWDTPAETIVCSAGRVKVILPQWKLTADRDLQILQMYYCSPSIEIEEGEHYCEWQQRSICFKWLLYVYHRDLNAFAYRALIILCLTYVPYSRV